MENPIKIDDLGGKNPLFLVQHPYMIPFWEGPYHRNYPWPSINHGLNQGPEKLTVFFAKMKHLGEISHRIHVWYIYLH